MSNDFYTHTGYPVNSGDGRAIDMRAELLALQAGFDKLPALTGNGGKILTVNAAGTGLTVVANATVDGTSWTPTLTAVTPGNLAVTYSTRTGRHIRFGSVAMASFTIVTSAFTHTTASGVLQISGMPVDAVGTSVLGSLTFSGITKAGYTQYTLEYTGAGIFQIFSAGSAVARASLAITDLPTGGSVILQGLVISVDA